MNRQTKNGISWTDFTWNPVIGCSNNCPKCYALTMAIRLAEMEDIYFDEVMTYAPPESTFHRKYSSGVVRNGKWTGKVFFDDMILDEPIRRKKPSKIFVDSMGDLLCPPVPDDWIKQVINIAEKCPQHTFQFLSQFPARYSEFDWPDNCWCGATVRTQEETTRLPVLLEAKAKIRFVSIEPILEEINLKYARVAKIDTSNWKLPTGVPKPTEGWSCTNVITPFKDPEPKEGETILMHSKRHEDGTLQWVIVGCATDSRAKDCKLEWIESVVEQGKVANVAVWVKQIPINGKPEKDITKFPKHLQLRQWP